MNNNVTVNVQLVLIRMRIVVVNVMNNVRLVIRMDVLHVMVVS